MTSFTFKVKGINADAVLEGGACSFGNPVC